MLWNLKLFFRRSKIFHWWFLISNLLRKISFTLHPNITNCFNLALHQDILFKLIFANEKFLSKNEKFWIFNIALWILKSCHDTDDDMKFAWLEFAQERGWQFIDFRFTVANSNKSSENCFQIPCTQRTANIKIQV